MLASAAFALWKPQTSSFLPAAHHLEALPPERCTKGSRIEIYYP
jgi:hypothetical protein